MIIRRVREEFGEVCRVVFRYMNYCSRINLFLSL